MSYFDSIYHLSRPNAGKIERYYRYYLDGKIDLAQFKELEKSITALNGAQKEHKRLTVLYGIDLIKE